MSKESALNLAKGGVAQVVASAPAQVEATQPPAGATATDVVPAVAVAATTEDSRLSIIIKKETELFKEKERIKKEREDMSAKAKEYESVISRIKAFEDTAKTSKVDALKMLGWTDTDIINLMATDKAAPTAEEIAGRIAEEKVKGLRDELSEKDKASAKARDEQLVNNFRTELGQTLKTDAAKYKFAAHEGKEAELQAWAIINENLKLNNELMTISEALEMTNELYKAKYESGRKLFEDIPASAVEPAPQTIEQPARGANSGRPPVSNSPARPRTLTNSLAPTSAAASNSQARETPEQKRQKLADRLRAGGLKR